MRRRVSLLLVPLAAAALATGCAQSDADVSITTKVKAKLEADRIITNASQIQVTTNKKVVTLSGPVQSQEAQKQAIKIARLTEGVKQVVDQLAVTPGTSLESAPQAPVPGGAPPAGASSAGTAPPAPPVPR